MYVIKTHDGASLSIKQQDPDMVKRLAHKLELTAVTLVDDSVVYLSKGTVARIEKARGQRLTDDKLLEAPDHRGSYSPAKEKLRKQYVSLAE